MRDARESLPFEGGAISFAAAADGGDGGCYLLTTTAEVRLFISQVIEG